jgi:hypothetical protein
MERVNGDANIAAIDASASAHSELCSNSPNRGIFISTGQLRLEKLELKKLGIALLKSGVS